MSFLSNSEYGKSKQDLVINYLEKEFGYTFLAGERYGKVVNIDFIEEMEHCEFIPAKNKYPSHGPQLKFTRVSGNFDVVTMPDLLIKRPDNNAKLYWIEVKSHLRKSGKLIIDSANFDDYELLYNKYTRSNVYVICVDPVDKDGTQVDMWFCNIQSLIDDKPDTEIINNNEVYVWNIDEKMTLLNKQYHILVDDYL